MAARYAVNASYSIQNSCLGIHIPGAVTKANSETDYKSNDNEKEYEKDDAGRLLAETAVSSLGWHQGIEGSRDLCLGSIPLRGCSCRRLFSTMARCRLPLREIMLVPGSILALKIHEQGAYTNDDVHVGRSQEQRMQNIIQSTEGKTLIYK